LSAFFLAPVPQGFWTVQPREAQADIK